MSYLLIDIGNSFAKYVLYDGKKLSNIECTATNQLIDNLPEFEQSSETMISKVIIVSVADEALTSDLVKKLSELFQCQVQQVKSTPSGFGVTCGYENFSLLGADRWVAILAAFNMNNIREDEAVLVIDCGTVVTADVIDHTGQHLGGWMIPSKDLMIESLVARSGGIRHGMENDSSEKQFSASVKSGRTTQQCVVSGTSLALTGFIERCISQSSQQLNSSVRCIVTGGGSDELLKVLPEKVESVPDLIFKGLILFCK